MLTIIMVAVIFCACLTSEKKYARSYAYVKTFLKEAGISGDAIIYFYKGRPDTTFPNVYCFESNGQQVMAPPQCFQVITDYIRLINDSTIPIKPNGWYLGSFLDTMKVIDVYNEEVDRSSLTGYDYYLFIDYIAIPLPGLQEALRKAQQATIVSKKKIRLFLVHAISEHNLHYFRKKAVGKPRPGS
jgi:hypothetical protein